MIRRTDYSPPLLLLTDWDGVICNSAPVLWQLYCEIVRPVDWREFKIFLENRKLTEPILPGRLRDYAEHLSKAELFEGALSFLEYAMQLGVPVAVVSNSSQQIIQAISERNSIAPLISRIYTSDDNLKKPSPELFELVMSDFGFTEKSILVVGDELTDVEFIEGREVRFVYCSYGFGALSAVTRRLNEIGNIPFEIAHDCADLALILERMISARPS